MANENSISTGCDNQASYQFDPLVCGQCAGSNWKGNYEVIVHK
jgi:hypothetical protein